MRLFKKKARMRIFIFYLCILNSKNLIILINLINNLFIFYKSEGKIDTDFDSRMLYLTNTYLEVGFSSLAASFLFNICFNVAAERQIKRIRNKLYKSLIGKDMGFFDKNAPRDLTAALTT